MSNADYAYVFSAVNPYCAFHISHSNVKRQTAEVAWLSGLGNMTHTTAPWNYLSCECLVYETLANIDQIKGYDFCLVYVGFSSCLWTFPIS